MGDLSFKVNGYMLEVVENSHVYLETPDEAPRFWEWEDESWKTSLMQCKIWNELSTFYGNMSNLTGNSSSFAYFLRLRSMILPEESRSLNLLKTSTSPRQSSPATVVLSQRLRGMAK